MSEVLNDARGGRCDVRVAVVGCGAWGRNHVRNYAELGALAALVDRHEDVVAGLVARYGGRALDFEAALADPAIDALVFALPPSQHHALGSRALEAGKHVFLEKPMALDVGEAKALRDLARARGRILMVGHLLQYHPIFVALREMVRGGALGRVWHISSRRLALGRIRRPEDVLWELAPHDVSMILSLVGEEPAGVDAFGAYHLDPAIADMTSVHLAFADGVRAEITASWLHPVKEHRLLVIGSEGMAVFDDGEPWERKLLHYPHRVEWWRGVPAPVAAEAIAVEVAPGEPLREECRHFLDCIRTGAPPRTDADEGIRVLDVLRRASEALEARRA